jgi:hypothetical protein
VATSNEASAVGVDVGEPAVEVVGGDEVVALGEVAPVGEDEIFDRVVRPARPGEEVVDVAAVDDRTGAVEAAAALHLDEARDESGWEGGSVDTEQVGVQCAVLEGDTGPAGDITGPVQLDLRPQQRSEYHELIGNAWQQPQHITSIGAK